MGIDHAGGVAEGFDDGSSHMVNLAVFDIDAEGGFRGVSGSTVKMELNSSGLFCGGDKNIFDASGNHAFSKQQRVSISSDGTTANILLSSNAGKLHIVSTGFTSLVISLPTSATGQGITAGMYWDIYAHTTVAAQVDISIIGAATGGYIDAHVATTGLIKTTGAVANLSSGPMWLRVMCDTTGAAPVYVISDFLGVNEASTGQHGGGLVAGSTVLTP
jgi:hypothetical protein